MPEHVPERGVAAQPGVVPGIRRAAGTMFAALYGELVPHAWRDPGSELDAYSLFYHRSIAMGWLDDTSAGGGIEDRMRRAPGLWGMNDAGWSHPLAAAGAGLISWFQVGASAVADDRPLPVQPFLRCAVDATARAGTPHLSTVQVLLPVQGLDPASRPPYAPVPAIQTVPWFTECDPAARTSVKVNINSGRDPVIGAVAQRLVDHLGRLDQHAFACGSHEVAGQDAVVPPPLHDRSWNGPCLHGVALRGELAEWSCDAVGWLAEAVADCTARLGIRLPLLLTVTRSRDGMITTPAPEASRYSR
ncbi:hypothetical protein ND748_01930 [Frankia sp. AiPs1]|uniref:hypothetical protein n=1 Tax=Frankia sp. AiPs1 TaxID=573493 RepID=UPI00204368F3|nr:hypothetical protein [Frankia sp. AiPs1]MCM3920446.1 hypothetical protein [Frankia sp. AiPs1]